MAIFNEILSARFARLAQKLFSMKGPQSTKQVAGEIIMTQHLPFGVEHRFLSIENRFGAFINITGGAAQFCGFRLRNPTNSGVICVVEGIWLGSAVQQNFNFDISGPVTADLPVSVFAERIDGRLGSSINRSTMSLSDQTTLASVVIGSIMHYVMPNTNDTRAIILTENQELTVAPGDALTIGNDVAAATIVINIWWRERQMEESERQ